MIDHWNPQAVVSRVKAPLVLAGAATVILYFMYRQVLSLNVFENIGASSTFLLLQDVIDKLFMLAAIAVILGAFIYLIPVILTAWNESRRSQAPPLAILLAFAVILFIAYLAGLVLAHLSPIMQFIVTLLTVVAWVCLFVYTVPRPQGSQPILSPRAHIPRIGFPVATALQIMASLILIIATIPNVLNWASSNQTVNSGFDIAVVEFDGRDGKWISSYIGDQLTQLKDSLPKQLGSKIGVQLIHLSHVDEASVREAASMVNAKVVVYGELNVSKYPYTFLPKFSVSQDIGGRLTVSDALTGDNTFGPPIRLYLPLSDAGNAEDLDRELIPRLQAFSLTVLGVASLVQDHPDEALNYLKQADTVEGPIPDKGAEVISLFEGSALARRWAEHGSPNDCTGVGRPTDCTSARASYQKALDLAGQQYARAHIGLGNLLFDQGVRLKGGLQDPALDKRWARPGLPDIAIYPALLHQAIDEYQAALDTKDTPPTAYVDAKAYFNQGLAYTYEDRFLAVNKECPGTNAISALQRAIAAYQNNADVSLVRELGSKAYYQLGLLYEDCGDRQSSADKKPEAAMLYAVAASQFNMSDKIATPDVVQDPGLFNLPIFRPAPQIHESPWQQQRWTAENQLAYTYVVQAELGDETGHPMPVLYTKAIELETNVTSYYEALPGGIPSGLVADSYFNLAWAYELSGDKPHAVSSYQKVQSLTQDSKDLQPIRAKTIERLHGLGQ